MRDQNGDGVLLRIFVVARENMCATTPVSAELTAAKLSLCKEPLVRAVAVPMFLQTVGAALEQEEIDNFHSCNASAIGET